MPHAVPLHGNSGQQQSFPLDRPVRFELTPFPVRTGVPLSARPRAETSGSEDAVPESNRPLAVSTANASTTLTNLAPSGDRSTTGRLQGDGKPTTMESSV